jgi:hypothetical protein
MTDSLTSIERFKSGQMRVGRRVAAGCFALIVLVFASGFRGGLVFGVPPVVVPPLSFAFGIAVLMGYLFIDSLRHGLVFTRGGIVDRASSRVAFLGYLALMGALSLIAGGAVLFLVIYMRANPGVV